MRHVCGGDYYFGPRYIHRDLQRFAEFFYLYSRNLDFKCILIIVLKKMKLTQPFYG
jgi:hypothetical protein